MNHPSRLAPTLKLRRKRKARQTRMNINVGVLPQLRDRLYGLN
jgi:hypothetical protein